MRLKQSLTRLHHTLTERLNKFKNLLKPVYRFLTYQAVREVAPQEPVDLSENQSYQTLKNLLLQPSQLHKLIILIGPWGSGKTTLLKQFEQKNKDLKFITKNYFGIENVDHAIKHQSGFIFRSLILILMAYLYFYIMMSDKLSQIFNIETTQTYQSIYISLFIAIFLKLFIPKNRIFFLSSTLLQDVVYKVYTLITKKKIIFLIEDLDRSSMPDSDRYSFLAQLPHSFSGSYLVTYGYNNTSEYLDITEIAEKIDATLITLNQNPKITDDIIYKNYPQICPFKEGSHAWLSKIPVRTHLSIFKKIQTENPNSHELKVKIKILNEYKNQICDKFISHEVGRDNSHIVLKFEDNNFSLASHPEKFTNAEKEITDSFCESINKDYFLKVLKDEYWDTIPRDILDDSRDTKAFAWKKLQNEADLNKYINK